MPISDRNKIIFNFERIDKNDKYCTQKVSDLVKFIIEHIDFLQCLCDALTKFCSYDSINEIGRGRKNKFKKFIGTIVFEDEKNYNYLDEFESTFREMYDIKSDYPNLSEEKIKDKLSKVRGVFLERLLQEFIQPRYAATKQEPYKNKFSTGCKINLNGTDLIISNRITVDIAGWNGVSGEFYEAKVGPQNFDNDVLKLLSLIKDEIDSLDIKNIVGCITMVNKDKLIEAIKIQECENSISYNKNIDIFGKYELMDLMKNPFPLSA